MIPPSACQPGQPDPRQLNPAQEMRCYTTRWDTIALHGLEVLFRDLAGSETAKSCFTCSRWLDFSLPQSE